jgi:aryl-alcohol dehydrogenase-like predicted oxidoreductase
MEKRKLGNTDLLVTPLGFGTAQIGFLDVPQSDCDRLLNGVLDTGINVIDTAAMYLGSEAKIGLAISSRRSEFVLVSKCGNHVADDDPPEWSGEIIRRSAERSLRRLQTDHLDVLLIHSCSRDHLKNEDMIGSLIKCRVDGLTRFIGYSGDDKDLEFALELGVFDCLEASVNICDQQILDGLLPRIKERNLGFFAKRPLANSCWREMSGYGAGYGDYARTYTERLHKMGFTPESLGFEGEWIDLALRFALFQPGLDVALTGGRNLDHLKQNIRLLDKGPLEPSIVKRIREVWMEHDDGSWAGQT